MRNHQHFFDTLDRKHHKKVLAEIKTTKPEKGHIIVYYSLEGMVIFEVIKDTPEVLLIEFISTAA